MKLQPLPAEDAEILRQCAIGYFKCRFPEYFKLNLCLRGDTLVVNCGRREAIPPLIREMVNIARKATVAIGINYVNLEINKQKIFGSSCCDSFEESQMVALFENEEVISVIGSHPELDIQPPAIDIDKEPGAIALVGISELSSELGWEPKKLLEALDYNNQRFFKEKNKEQMLALAGICFPGVKAEYINKALDLIKLFRMEGAYGIEEGDKEATQIWLSLYQVPGMSRDIVDRLKKWNPDCVSEVPASSPSVPAATAPRRGRKPKTETVADERPTTALADGKPYRTIDDPKIEEQISRAINNGRWTTVAKLVLKSVGDRAEEFATSAQQIDDRYTTYLDKVLNPIVKAMGLTGNKAKEKREEFKGHITQKFNEMSTNETAEAA